MGDQNRYHSERDRQNERYYEADKEDMKATMAEEEGMYDLMAAVAEAIMVVEKEAAESLEARDARGAEGNATGASTPQVTMENRASEAVTTSNIFYKGWQGWL